MKKIIKYTVLNTLDLLNLSNFIFKNSITDKNLIFMFHDVSNNPKEFFTDNNLNHSTLNFEKQLNFINSNFKIINPNSLNSYDRSDPTAIISFDDGANSFYTNASKILLDHNIPSIHFLNYSQINGKVFLPGLIGYIMKYEKKIAELISITNIQNLDLNVLNKISKKKLIKLIRDSREYYGSFMNNNQINELDNKNIFFWGNHLFRHLNTVNLKDYELIGEFKKNDFFLKKLKSYNSYFSYPFGQKNQSYNPRTNEIIKNLDTNAIFTANPISFNSRNQDIFHRVGLHNKIDTNKLFIQHLVECKLRSLIRHLFQ